MTDKFTQTFSANAGDEYLALGVQGDTLERFGLTEAGMMGWGPGGNSAFDVFLQRLGPGILGVPPGGSFQSSSPVIQITASTTISGSLHNGATLLFDVAAGATLTLPAATGSGNTYIIANAVTVTSNNNIIQVANSNDYMIGNAYLFSSGTPKGVSTANTGTPSTESDTITMNGSTTGGIKGDYIEIIDVLAHIWVVRGELNASGTAATPFSASV